MIARFQLALLVKDLDMTRAFDTGMLGCREGRSSETWVDFGCT
ncbi:MAG: VOC family protein, partial [Gammaproteobacteria bacterium]